LRSEPPCQAFYPRPRRIGTGLISDRAPTGIGDTQTINRERPAALHSQRLSHDRCEPGERKHCQRLTGDLMTKEIAKNKCYDQGGRGLMV
jgi:hypothetical protein